MMSIAIMEARDEIEWLQKRLQRCGPGPEADNEREHLQEMLDDKLQALDDLCEELDYAGEANESGEGEAAHAQAAAS